MIVDKDIIGGVSPLKARKSAGKAGDVGKKATATRAQDKSGFSRSDTVDTGKGYKANLESLTAGMRTQGSLAAALGAKGPGGQPTKRGDKKDDFGGSSTFEETDDVFTTEHKQDPDEVEKKETHESRMKRYQTSGKQILHTYGHDFMKEFDHLIKGEGQKARIIFPDEETYYRYMDKYREYKKAGHEKHSSVSTSTKMIAGQKYERKLKNGKPIVSSNTDADGWYEI